MGLLLSNCYVFSKMTYIKNDTPCNYCFLDSLINLLIHVIFRYINNYDTLSMVCIKQLLAWKQLNIQLFLFFFDLNDFYNGSKSKQKFNYVIVVPRVLTPLLPRGH